MTNFSLFSNFNEGDRLKELLVFLFGCLWVYLLALSVSLKREFSYSSEKFFSLRNDYIETLEMWDMNPGRISFSFDLFQAIDEKRKSIHRSYRNLKKTLLVNLVSTVIAIFLVPEISVLFFLLALYQAISLGELKEKRKDIESDYDYLENSVLDLFFEEPTMY